MLSLQRSLLIRPHGLFPMKRTAQSQRPYTKPPSYFGDHLNRDAVPRNVLFPLDPDTTTSLSSPTPSSITATTQYQDQSSPSSSSYSRFSPIRDLSFIISILALTYFAVDNYKTRLVLEQKLMEQSMAHVKGLSIAQGNFNNQKRKKEIMNLNERRNAQKREMKMVYHVAMLRKQLVDLGVKPVDIDEAIKDFEKNVKMETSISNVSGTALWVVDESPMKPYVPNTRDYETRNK